MCFFIIEVCIALAISLAKKRNSTLEINIFSYKINLNKKIYTIIIWIIMLVWYAEKLFGFIQWVNNQFMKSTLIEDEYRSVEDIEIVFPDEKRNLICIFMESAETSTQDIANGGVFENNYIP